MIADKTYPPRCRGCCNLVLNRLSAQFRRCCRRAVVSRSMTHSGDQRRLPFYKLNEINFESSICVTAKKAQQIDRLVFFVLKRSIKCWPHCLITLKLPLTLISLSRISHENIPGFSFFISSIRVSISGVAKEFSAFISRENATMESLSMLTNSRFAAANDARPNTAGFLVTIKNFWDAAVRNAELAGDHTRSNATRCEFNDFQTNVVGKWAAVDKNTAKLNGRNFVCLVMLIWRH